MLPTSNPPAVGTISFVEGLALESVVDLSSIPSAHTSHTDEETEEIDLRTQRKRSREEVDPEEVTSSLLGSAKRQEVEEPVAAVPLASKPPAGSAKPARLFSLGSR